jgi:hypothetical protein
MDTDTLVENRIRAGWEFIDRLVENHFDVTAAFWIQASEEGRWFLYIASTAVDEMGPAAAYRDVYSTLQSMPDFSSFRSELKLIGAANPITRDVLEIRQRNATKLPARYHGPQVGNIAIEEAYVYPSITAGQHETPLAPPGVVDTVLRLMQRRGRLQPSTVTLRDGSSFQGIPVGLELKTGDVMEVKFVDADTNLPRATPASEIAGIS